MAKQHGFGGGFPGTDLTAAAASEADLVAPCSTHLGWVELFGSSTLSSADRRGLTACPVWLDCPAQQGLRPIAIVAARLGASSGEGARGTGSVPFSRRVLPCGARSRHPRQRTADSSPRALRRSGHRCAGASFLPLQHDSSLTGC